MNLTLDASELKALDQTILQYKQHSRKYWPEIIARQTRELAYYLYRAYAEIAPAKGKPWVEAKARGYETERKGIGISPKAREFAANYMSGNKSILAYIFPRKEGFDIRSIRVGKRGKILRGSKQGRKGIAASYTSARSLLASDKRYSGADMSDYKMMNRRAVEVFFELMLRSRGRKSLAVGWLAGIKNQLSSQAARAGASLSAALEHFRAAKHWISSVNIVTRGGSCISTLSSSVPGTKKRMDRIKQAMAYARLNMLQYIWKKMNPKANKTDNPYAWFK